MEVEVKLEIRDPQVVESKLKGFEFLGERVEEDTYFNFDCVGGCCRDFAKTDEAIRVRRKNGEIILTYKGPRKGEGIKAREEIEVKVDNFENLVKLLEKLCLKPVITIRKKRKEWKVKNFKVTLDYVEGLGWFVEIEGMGSPEELKEKIERLARELVPEGKRVEKTYLEMYLERVKNSKS